MRISLLVIILFFLLNIHVYPEDVHISLFNEYSLSSIVITPVRGDYELITDGGEPVLVTGKDLLYISMTGDRLLVRDGSGPLGVFSLISFNAVDGDGEFSIRPVGPSMKVGVYNGSLELKVEFERIRIINSVDEDMYLAGVVEAESGTGSHHMFYMAQAVICRTYLYGNLHRHAEENFDLCDGVHCQVYKGRLTGNENICEAVNMTTGKVIVHGESGLITAAFHANCGGETVSSEEMWLVSTPYLRSVSDPYCSGKPSARWQMNIDSDNWHSYLVNMGLDEKKRTPGSFIFRQQKRRALYIIDDFTIPFRKLRTDWDFRSAYFNVEHPGPGQQLLIKGKGYGHGVGLCQEGAMEMAVRGYNFMEILQFYYTDIIITDTGELF